MDAFFASLAMVTFSEIGDKTQLLALFLATRFTRKYAIVAGIVAATLLNHAVSAFFGVWLTQWLPEKTLAVIVGISFIAVGLWLLKPDKDEEVDSPLTRYGAFAATCVLFFLAELGDKTQLATVLLAAHYGSLLPVIAGSTLGMVLADVPVVFLGSWLMTKMPFKTIRLISCLLFCVLGGITLWRVF